MFEALSREFTGKSVIDKLSSVRSILFRAIYSKSVCLAMHSKVIRELQNNSLIINYIIINFFTNCEAM